MPNYTTGLVFSYKLRYIVGFGLVEMAITTNQKPTIYRNLYENTGPQHNRQQYIITWASSRVVYIDEAVIYILIMWYIV